MSFAYPASGRTTRGGGAAAPVLAGVSLRLAPGRLTAIIGPNAAGKSTLLKLLLGLLQPKAGRVELDGAGLEAMSHAQRVRALAYVPQSSSLAFSYATRDVVAMGRLVEGGSGSAEAVDAALARVDMLAQADVPFAHLSAGQRQRVTLARALVQLELACEGTRVLLCDEPVSAMDPRHALEAMSLLRDLAVRKGVAVGVVLHDLSAALRFADDAVALGADGRVLAAGLAAEVLRAEVLERLFGVAFVVVQQPGVRAVVVGEASGTLDAPAGQ